MAGRVDQVEVVNLTVFGFVLQRSRSMSRASKPPQR